MSPLNLPIIFGWSPLSVCWFMTDMFSSEFSSNGYYTLFGLVCQHISIMARLPHCRSLRITPRHWQTYKHKHAQKSRAAIIETAKPILLILNQNAEEGRLKTSDHGKQSAFKQLHSYHSHKKPLEDADKSPFYKLCLFQKHRASKLPPITCSYRCFY